MSCRNLSLVWVLTTILAAATPLWADDVQLAPNHPERYTVVKGDTLWDISARFLKDPWRWASVWKINQQIKNPHLIYPGDIIVLTYVDGQPQLSVLREEKPAPTVAGEAPAETPAGAESAREAITPAPHGMNVVKLTPKARVESLADAIPTISPGAIVPFLTQPLVVGKRELEKAGYVTTGLDDRVALGDGSEFYARGLGKNPVEFYQVFRQGPALRNPDTGELLAYEAMYLGDATLLKEGDPAKLVVTSVKQEIVPTDRLLAAPQRASLPYYYPHSPDKDVHGRILSAVNGLVEFGPNTIVAISLGEREGMQEGHVLRIMRHAGQHKDPVTNRFYKLPDEETGLLMIFRVYEKVSYALIMNAERPVHIHDAVKTP
jgi:nucleoid-associated protein YgaU